MKHPSGFIWILYSIKKNLQAHVHVLAMPKLSHSPWFSSHLMISAASSFHQSNCNNQLQIGSTNGLDPACPGMIN